MSKVEALTLHVIAERLEHGESQAIAINIAYPLPHEPVAVGQVFAFHDGEEIGSKMFARIAKHTGLSRDL